MQFIRSIIFLLLIFIIQNSVAAQDVQKSYWSAAGHAHSFFDVANYKDAVVAYEVAFAMEKESEIASHRLYAAASYCMLDDEQGVRKHLFEIVPIATEDDMKKVLVNYEIFRKYHHTDWWKELDEKMAKRLENLIAHHKDLHFFQVGRNYVYRAIRINANGDTLANTRIIMKPDGTGWGHPAASSQSQIVYEYEYSVQDSLDHIDELIKVVQADFWKKIDTTGVIENETELWIHPMRYNEFFKTELAPFPVVKFPISQETIEKANSKIMILRNWGTYTSSETHNEYSYLGKEKRSYLDLDPLDCHKFHAIGFNNFHGMSEMEYFFHEDYGFLEMNIETYDDDKISFLLVEIDYTDLYKNKNSQH